MPPRRLPSLHALRAFEAAARHLSISRAADELCVTPGAVSRHVRALEAEMGAGVSLRRAQGLSLTAAGEALARSAREAFDRLSDSARSVWGARLRRLRVGAYGFFVSRALLPRWDDLRASQPDLELLLETSVNPLDLSPNQFDAVIAVSDLAPRAGLVTRPLMPIATAPVCAPALLSGAGVADVAGLPQLHVRPRPDDWRRWLDHAGRARVPSEPSGVYESLGLALEAARAGLGCVIGIEGLLGPDLADGGLVLASPIVRPTRRWFALTYDARLVGDPALTAFETWLAAQSPAGSAQAVRPD